MRLAQTAYAILVDNIDRIEKTRSISRSLDAFGKWSGVNKPCNIWFFKSKTNYLSSLASKGQALSSKPFVSVTCRLLELLVSVRQFF